MVFPFPFYHGGNIAVFDGGIKNFRGLGLVQEAFREFEIDGIEGNVGIGHVYYSVKISMPENAQPTLLHTHAGDIAIAHNGIITNSEKLKEELMEKRTYILLRK